MGERGRGEEEREGRDEGKRQKAKKVSGACLKAFKDQKLRSVLKD